MRENQRNYHSKAIVISTRRNGNVLFRSKLEAKWATFFDSIEVAWEYEPEKFYLPGGSTYTPDFYLENIGWVEIKPSFEKFLCKKDEYKAFVENMDTLISPDKNKSFIVFCEPFPSFEFSSERAVMLINGVDNVVMGQSVGYNIFLRHESLSCALNEGRHVFVRLLDCLLQKVKNDGIGGEPKKIDALLAEALVNDFGIDFNIAHDYYTNKTSLDDGVIYEMFASCNHRLSTIIKHVFARRLEMIELAEAWRNEL